MQLDCIVVGAGVLGSSTAYQLAKGGYSVLLFDQFPLPHSRGSSGGAVRYLRYGYNEEGFHEDMPDQYVMWHQLEKEASTTLTHPVTSLVLAPPGNDAYISRLHVAKTSGLAIRDVDRSDVERLCYPMMMFPKSQVGHRQDEMLVIDAAKSVRCLQEQFVKYGGSIQDNEKVLKIEPGPVVTVYTDRGQYRAKGVVVTVGPWAVKMLPALGLHLPIKAWRVNVSYFKEKVPESFSNIPLTLCYVDEKTGTRFVVFPSREYPGLVKVNYHVLWDEVDPDYRDIRRAGQPQFDINAVKEFVRTYCPGLETEPCFFETCMYTCTPKEEMAVGTHPLHSNIAIGCSMSGNGFKMAPLVGKVLGEMALGKPPSWNTRRISINRFLPPPKL